MYKNSKAKPIVFVRPGNGINTFMFRLMVILDLSDFSTRTFVAILVLLGVVAPNLCAQKPDDLRDVMKDAKSYRVDGASSMIDDVKSGSYYLVRADDQMMRDLLSTLQPIPGISEAAQRCSASDQSTIDNKVHSLNCPVTIDSLHANPVIVRILRGSCADYANYCLLRRTWECKCFKSAWIITSPVIESRPFQIVGLVTSASDSKNAQNCAKQIIDVIPAATLKQLPSPDTLQSKNLYSFLTMSIVRLRDDLSKQKAVKDLAIALESGKNYDQSVLSLSAVELQAARSILFPDTLKALVGIDCDSSKRQIIDNELALIGCGSGWQELSSAEDLKKVLKGDCMKYAKYAVLKKQWQCKQFTTAIIVCHKSQKESECEVLYLVTSRDISGSIPRALNGFDEIYSASQLKGLPSPLGARQKSMYDFVSAIAARRLLERK